MNQEGPTLERLLRRLIETPEDFLAEPHTYGGSGIVHVPAVASDMLEFHGHTGIDVGLLKPSDTLGVRRVAGLSLLLSWLLADPELISLKISATDLYKLLTEGAFELASQNPAAKYRDDSERREEFVRFTLSQLDLRPSGETLNQAQDRLTSISSVERNRVLAASRAAEQRARKIREQLARDAARESADKYTRE